MACQDARSSLTVMLSAPGDVFPARRMASFTSSGVTSVEKGTFLGGSMDSQGSSISFSEVRRSKVARLSASAFSCCDSYTTSPTCSGGGWKGPGDLIHLAALKMEELSERLSISSRQYLLFSFRTTRWKSLLAIWASLQKPSG